MLSGPAAVSPFWLGACARPADFLSLARTAAGLPAHSPSGEPLPLRALCASAGAPASANGTRAIPPPGPRPPSGGAREGAGAAPPRRPPPSKPQEQREGGVTLRGMALHGATWLAGGARRELEPSPSPSPPLAPTLALGLALSPSLTLALTPHPLTHPHQHPRPSRAPSPQF